MEYSYSVSNVRKSWPLMTSPASLSRASTVMPSDECRVTERVTTGSVEEVPRPREVHRDAGLLRGRDDLLVADRTAGLDDARYAGLDEDLEPVVEREERVARGDRALGPLRPPARTASLRSRRG